jgi:hypothetical protein
MSDNRHVADLYLKLGGADAPRELVGDVLEITVESSLHLPDVATVVLNDRQLKWVDDSRLAPGGLIEVSARHGRTTESIFEGEIVEIEPQFEAEGLKVTVRAFDRLHRLGRGRHTRTFLNVTDSDVITQIAVKPVCRCRSTPRRRCIHTWFSGTRRTLSFSASGRLRWGI